MRCQDTAIGPNGRCRRHGKNNAPPGPGHPAWKTGEHSKLNDGRSLLDRAAELASNPELLDLSRDVALLEVLKLNLAESIDTAATVELWSKARGQLNKLTDAMKSGDADSVRESIAALKSTLQSGHQDARNRRELDRTIQSKRRVVESHRKAQIESGGMIPLPKVHAMMDTLVNNVIAAKTWEEGLRALQVSYSQLLGLYDHTKHLEEETQTAESA